jgi:hypothetical protein
MPKAVTSGLPTVKELSAALKGKVPERHSAREILLATYMLATVDEWINPDAVVVDSGEFEYEGSWALGDIGISDCCDPLRMVIIDRINH